MVLKYLALAGLAYLAWRSSQPPLPPSGGIVVGQPNDWDAWEAANPEIMERVSNIEPYIDDYSAHLSDERNWYIDSLGNRRFRGGL